MAYRFYPALMVAMLTVSSPPPNSTSVADHMSYSTPPKLALGPNAMAKIQTPQPVRGTQDMFGETEERFAHVVATFERVRRLYGFKGLQLPVIEPTAVYSLLGMASANCRLCCRFARFPAALSSVAIRP